MHVDVGRPLISVCMAAYNGADFILDQIASILSELEAWDELIVVDDCSTDGTPEIVEAIGDSRIRLIRAEQNRGYVKTFEAALKEAKNDVIFLSDQDDIWMPGRVAVMLDALGNNIMVVSNCEHFGAEPSTFQEIRVRSEQSSMRVRNCVGIIVGYRLHWGCAMAFRKRLLEVVLPFPRYMRESHDQYLALAANVLGSVCYLENDTIWHRLHSSNLTPQRVRSPSRILKARLAFLGELGVLIARSTRARGRERILPDAEYSPLSDGITIVVSCFNPPFSLVSRVERWSATIGPVIAVDDGSDRVDAYFWQLLRDAGAEVVTLERNSGIAAALNAGIRTAIETEDPEWILTMDQDSDLSDDYVSAALGAFDGSGDAPVGLLCSGSQNGYVVPLVRSVSGITESFDPMQSGTMIRRDVISDIGLFREDFFIDAVDSEYTARARQAGWYALAVPGADLVHALGEARPMTLFGRRLTWFGKPLSVYEHQPFRVYFMTRNSLLLARTYFAKQPRWVVRRLVTEFESHVIRFVFGPARAKNLVAVIYGIRDAMLNRTGPISSRLRKRL